MLSLNLLIKSSLVAMPTIGLAAGGSYFIFSTKKENKITKEIRSEKEVPLKKIDSSISHLSNSSINRQDLNDFYLPPPEDSDYIEEELEQLKDNSSPVLIAQYIQRFKKVEGKLELPPNCLQRFKGEVEWKSIDGASCNKLVLEKLEGDDKKNISKWIYISQERVEHTLKKFGLFKGFDSSKEKHTWITNRSSKCYKGEVIEGRVVITCEFENN